MSGYENSPDAARKHVAELFQQVVPDRVVSLPCDNAAGDWKVRRIRLSGRGGAALAKGVNALRFTIATPGGNPPFDTYDSVYGEIAAYAVPNPSANRDKRP
ncbi:MAG: hypothetical protein A2V98_14675 [Planctomycetes bacterium RBG_16_64_12]|nr:MAG: hypothetical protein A2V98_14675 [Planctomycetes bacterium RBG_16_64_12]